MISSYYFYSNWSIGLVGRVFAKGSKTEVQSQVESYQRLKKHYLILPCLTLSIIRYESKVKWSNPGKEWHPSLHLGVVAIEKGAFKSQLRSPTFTYFYSIIIICLHIVIWFSSN